MGNPWRRLASSSRGPRIVARRVSQRQAGGNAHGDGRSFPPPPEPEVEYVYEFRVVRVGDQVKRAIEAQLRGGLREDDTPVGGDGAGGDAQPGRRMYMPAMEMETLLGSLIGELEEAPEEEEEPAFTFFVLNPRRMWSLPEEAEAYGYRCGLSASHMAALAATDRVVKRAEYLESQEVMSWRSVVQRLHGSTEVRGRRREGRRVSAPP